MMIFRIVLLVVFSLPLHAETVHPDCSGKDRWPASMALVHLKNAGLISHSEVDLSLTVVKRLSSEEIDNDAFSQIHKVIFTKKDGQMLTVITDSNASNQECSISGVDVYIVSNKLGDK